MAKIYTTDLFYLETLQETNINKLNIIKYLNVADKTAVEVIATVLCTPEAGTYLQAKRLQDFIIDYSEYLDFIKVVDVAYDFFAMNTSNK